jgi:hypothetical protein
LRGVPSRCVLGQEVRHDIVDQMRADLAANKFGASHHEMQERDRCAESADREKIERAPHAPGRFGAGRAVNDEFRQHRVIENRDGVARVAMRIEPDIGPNRRRPCLDEPRVRAKAGFRNFSVYAAFDLLMPALQ